MVFKNFIRTAKHIMIAFDTKVWTIPKGDPYFEAANRFINEGQTDELSALCKLAGEHIEPVKIQISSEQGQAKPEPKTVISRTEDKAYIVVDGIKMPAVLGKAMLTLITKGESVEYLKNFWNRLRKNPDESSKQQLYGFLKNHHITILDDGCLLLYKRVRDDFRDFYTGKMDNSPGMVVKMPREKVLNDPSRHCGEGLHCASFDYMPIYHGGQGKIIELRLDPKHVVSIPTDCNGDKLRVCEYKVLRLFLGGGVNEPVSKEPKVVKSSKPKKSKMDKLLNGKARKKARYEAKQAMQTKPVVKQGLKPDTKLPKIKLNSDTNRGRVRIPSKLIIAIGGSFGDTIYCEYTRGKIVLRKEQTADSSKYAYTINKDNGFKLSKDVLVASGLNNGELYAEVVGDVILIKAK